MTDADFRSTIPTSSERSGFAGERDGVVPLFNRELSWLEFNRRVLEEATDNAWPLLERLKFLSIFSTNLDEFFMIRVSGLKEQISEDMGELSSDGMSASDQLAAIYKNLRPLLKRQATYLREVLLPELAAQGISIESYSSLSGKEKKKLDRYFRDNLFPILTPQSVDASHPFPYISNLSLNLGLSIEPDKTFTNSRLKHLFRERRFTRIKLPPTAPRLIAVDQKKGRYVPIEEIAAANVAALFPNMTASKAFVFRVTRDADIEIREDEASDLLRTMERELQRRRDRFPVRLEVAADMPDRMVKVLESGIGIAALEVEKVEGIIDISGLMQMYSLPRPELKDPSLSTSVPSVIATSADIFAAIRKSDILLHHPFTAFSAVADLIAKAADDPNVQAIKICLYRAGKDSPIVDSLMRASRTGKQVTAVIELKARFDEGNNIEWAKRLENEGVHVVYGISSLKTHSKVALIVRREGNKLVRYVHVGTGNYNPVTARVYTDIGLLTVDRDICDDVTSLFNFLTGYSQQTRYKRLLVAPIELREQLIRLIKREVKAKRAGKDAGIVIKINSLTDSRVIHQLYAASREGVQIDLVIRGICSLRPGIAGMSENIRVRSLVGRFLEHSRIYYFKNGGAEEELYIGSSDIMNRSFDRRVEVLTPVLDQSIKETLRDVILPAYLRDEVNARVLNSDGTYSRVKQRSEGGFNAQMYFAGLNL